MGTDIHMHCEKRSRGASPWVLFKPDVQCEGCGGTGKDSAEKECQRCWGTGDIGYDDRNYRLFAILGNVRNDHTDPPIRSISDGRGLPEDLSPELRRIADMKVEDVWLGEHSFSWVSLQELIQFDWEQTTVRRGVIRADRFLYWDGKCPDEFAQAVWGPDIRVTDWPCVGEPPRAPERAALDVDSPTHVRVRWRVTYREAAGKAFGTLMEALKPHGEPENIRLVFGFDS